MEGSVITAILLATLAGLATTLGSLISIFFKNPSPRFMAFTMGFSAGVMVLVSFVELLRQGISIIGFANAHVAFFAGMLAMFAIDYFIPHTYIMEGERDTGKLRKATLLTAIGIGIHNFPEGMATLAATLQDTGMGVAVAAVIAIHNIPEGIAVAVPVRASTGSARKAFFWSFLSGVSEPVGAIAAALFLAPVLTPALLAVMLCVVAGFMVFISFDELLPIAQSYQAAHVAILGVISGMAIMAISLAMLV